MHEDDDIWSHGTWGFKVLHGLTPETEGSAHQYRYVAIPRGHVAPATLDEFKRQCDQIINEDRDIFALQQAALDADPRNLTAWNVQSAVTIHADQGLLLARRMLERRIKSELSPATAVLAGSA